MFQKIAKHRANDASNDIHRPPLPGWEEFDGKCYFWSQEKLFWAAAEMKCREMGGHLASVTSNDTHDYLTMNVSSFQISSTITFVYQEKNIRSIWVGGTDQFQERNWTWTDCSPWNFTRWGNRSGYMQPDNVIAKDGNGEDCIVLPSINSSNIDWADEACNLKERQFFCSKPICSPGRTP